MPVNHRSDEDLVNLVAGAVLGILVAAALATPFYGIGPTLAVIGALFVLAFAIRLISGHQSP